MKPNRRLCVRAGLLALVFMAVLVAIFMGERHVPITITGFHHSREPDRLTVEVRNDAPGRVKVCAVHVWSRVGTNWALVRQFPLGFANSTERWIHIDVDAPSAWPRPWKASLEYMPQFQGLELLQMRLKDAWRGKSL